MKARTINQSWTELVFVHHNRQLCPSLWVSASAVAHQGISTHLKIHWAGSTAAGHIHVSEGYHSLHPSDAYTHILHKKGLHILGVVQGPSSQDESLQGSEVFPGQRLQDPFG